VEEEKVTRHKKLKSLQRSPHLTSFTLANEEGRKGRRELRKTSRQALGRTIAFLACFDL